MEYNQKDKLQLAKKLETEEYNQQVVEEVFDIIDGHKECFKIFQLGECGMRNFYKNTIGSWRHPQKKYASEINQDNLEIISYYIGSHTITTIRNTYLTLGNTSFTSSATVRSHIRGLEDEDDIRVLIPHFIALIESMQDVIKLELSGQAAFSFDRCFKELKEVQPALLENSELDLDTWDLFDKPGKGEQYKYYGLKRVKLLLVIKEKK